MMRVYASPAQKSHTKQVCIDRFGKNQIALLKVTKKPLKPHLLKEFTWLGHLLKKGTEHDLYTPGVHTEGFQREPTLNKRNFPNL
ncbi:MAG: hypothetical protein KFB95_01325 [Simkaniaceae bacterium]|nr:MAG: hypothetical protein KFB95_01325 [Simkaniaceae bacterium]